MRRIDWWLTWGSGIIVGYFLGRMHMKRICTKLITDSHIETMRQLMARGIKR